MQTKHSAFLHLRRDIELHLNTHSGQLDIQVAQDTRNSNDSDVRTANELVTSAVLPGVAPGLRASSFGTTSSTPDVAGIDTLSVAILVDSWLCGKERSTTATNPCFLVIGTVHQTILQQECCAVGNQRISLHLTDTDTTTLSTTLDGLTSQGSDGTGGTDLELVVDHVTQTLVVDNTHIDVSTELLTCDTRVHGLVPVVVEASTLQLVTEVLDGGLACCVLELERCAVLRNTVQTSGLTSQRLDEHTDGHTRRESVRVDDDIGLNTALAEGHIHGGPLL